VRPKVSLREALNDPQLLGYALAGDSFAGWRTLLITAMGEPLISDEEHAAFTKLTGRTHEPLQRVSELELVCGRRSGKTRALATLSAYLSGLVDYRDVLVPGETGVLLCLAQDQRVAKQLLGYAEADFAASPILSQLIVNRTSDTIELKGNIKIEVRPASMKKLRGPTYVGILLDELAFWFTEADYANPDTEVIAAVTPGLLTTHGMIIMASSPYAKRGVLWETFKKHYGPNGSPSVLVAQATTRDLNPTVEQEEIDRLIEKDPARNRAEMLAEFRSDQQSFVSVEVVEACIVEPGLRERPPMRDVTYFGAADPSGGSSDSFTACCGHLVYGRDVCVVDALLEIKAPFSPEAATKEISEFFKRYGVTSIIGDRYAGEWPSEMFSKFGIHYEPSARPKNELYQDLLPLLNSCRIELIDNQTLVSQLVGLERRTGRNRDVIDHSPQGRDDVANVVALIASATINRYGSYDINGWSSSSDDEEDRDGARMASDEARTLPKLRRHVSLVKTQTQQEINMTTQRRHNDDDDSILRDGERRSFPMMMRDGAPNRSLSDVQRAVAMAAQQHDASFGDAAAHRPGYRYTSNDAVYDAKRRARDAYERDMSEAWRGNQMDADTPVGAYREDPTTCAGDQSTIDGRPGTLQPVAGHPGWLECRPPDGSKGSHTDALPSREEAYAAYEASMRDAWKHAS
jgi:hypothetical protein